MNRVVPIAWLGSTAPRVAPLVGSGVVHGALLASVALGRLSAHAPPGVEESIVAIETMDDEPVPRPVEAPRDTPDDAPSRSPAALPASHTHAYPVPKSHDATPHDPATDHRLNSTSTAEERTEAPQVLAATPAQLPRFTINVGAAVPRSGDHSASSLGPTTPVAPLETFTEAAVSVPARLLASAAASYPAGARANDVEADVQLEIVVDTTGAVVEARTLTRAGFGLDEAALSAIRKYRFSPAQRDGRLVRVRMRWSVQFRLH